MDTAEFIKPSKEQLMSCPGFIGIANFVRSTYTLHKDAIDSLETSPRTGNASGIARKCYTNETLRETLNQIAAEYFSAHIEPLITMDMMGHFKTGKKGSDHNPNLIYDLRSNFVGSIRTAISRLSDLVDSDEKMLEHFFDCYVFDYEFYTINLTSNTREACHHCGNRVSSGLDLVTMKLKIIPNFIDDKYIKFAMPSKCQYPNGIGEHSILLEVPSGKLVFANTFTHLLTDDEHEALAEARRNLNHIGVNYPIGRKQNTDHYASLNIMCFQVGNSSPQIFKTTQKNTISIKPEYIFKSGRDVRNYRHNESLEGSVTTDVWVVSAIDGDELQRRCKHHSLDMQEVLKKINATVVEIEPGSYVCTSHYEKLNNPVRKYIEIKPASKKTVTR